MVSPDGLLCAMIEMCSGAFVKPPASGSAATVIGAPIVVLVRSGELHPVAISGWMDGVCESVADVSAESCHVQTVLLGLRSH